MQEVVSIDAMTIQEFCTRTKICRAKLYVMFKNGTGPSSYKVGRRRYITVKAALQWQEELQ